MVDSGINYKIPLAWEKYVLMLVAGMVVGFLLIQISFSQVVIAQSLEALDLECRETYHSYCFGDEWQNIVDRYNNDTRDENIKADIEEDESYLCLKDVSENVTTKGDLVCAELDWLDFLNETQEQKINEIFSNNLDTFNAKELLK